MTQATASSESEWGNEWGNDDKDREAALSEPGQLSLGFQGSGMGCLT